MGRYVSESGLGFVAPDNRRIVHDVAIAPGKNLRAKPGQIVVAKITEYPSHVTQAIGEIVRILGDEHAAGMETDIAIHAHELPHEWPAVIKGDGRPIKTQTERANILSALRYVDYITIFDESTPEHLIGEIRPDILVKGNDYNIDEVVGREIVEGYGARVELIPIVKGLSTTNTVEQILEKHKAD